MPSISIRPFTGEVPALSANLLPDTGAQRADNVKLYSGELRSWRKALKVSDPGSKLVPLAKTIYKLYGPGGAQRWLSWTSDVDVAASALADTTDFRVYYTGGGPPRKTNWALASPGVGPYPADYLELGVPKPSAAPNAAIQVAGSGGTSTDYVYIITHVSTFGTLKEESAPSSPRSITVALPVGATVRISGFPALPAGKYNITHRRIYRTLAGTSSYGLVAEIPVATTQYDDATLTQTLTTICQTIAWGEPPSTLTGLVAMANGMHVGFTGKEIWFCEPYYYHAYPPGYVQTVDANIVGLAVYGTTLIVLTDSGAYLFTGNSPSAMTQETLKIPHPCVSKRSISYDESGAVYSAPNGIAAVGPGIRGLISEWAFGRDEWQEMNPANRFGKIFGSNYILFDDSDNTGVREALIFPRAQQIGLSHTYFPATAFYVDPSNGAAYAASGIDNFLYQFDADPTNNMLFGFKSKRYVVPQPVNFTCFYVDGDYFYLADTSEINAAIAAIIAANQALFISGRTKGPMNEVQYNTFQWNGSLLQSIPNAADFRSINVQIFANTELVYSGSVFSRDPIRLPEYAVGTDWEIFISGNVPVRGFAMATSIDELRKV